MKFRLWLDQITIGEAKLYTLATWFLIQTSLKYVIRKQYVIVNIAAQYINDW